MLVILIGKSIILKKWRFYSEDVVLTSDNAILTAMLLFYDFELQVLIYWRSYCLYSVGYEKIWNRAKKLTSCFGASPDNLDFSRSRTS